MNRYSFAAGLPDHIRHQNLVWRLKFKCFTWPLLLATIMPSLDTVVGTAGRMEMSEEDMKGVLKGY
jgi:hypothetical protein